MFRKILVATDGSGNSRAAVRKAIQIAKKARSPLLVVSVADVTEEFRTVAPELEEKMVGESKKIVTSVVRQAAKSGVRAEGIVLAGEPYDLITKTAEAKKADLIVMGSHGRTGLKRLLMGSVTSGVIGHTTASVLVVKT